MTAKASRACESDLGSERLRCPTLVGFGGNAWNAWTMALTLHALFPDRDACSTPRLCAEQRQAKRKRSAIGFGCDFRPPAADPGRRPIISSGSASVGGSGLSRPPSTCGGADPRHAIRLARDLGPRSLLVSSCRPASPPSYAHGSSSFAARSRPQPSSLGARGGQPVAAQAWQGSRHRYPAAVR